MAPEEHMGDAGDAPRTHTPPPQPALEPPAGQGPQPPEWAGALRQMYDAVVEEPLPDGIAQLLARLDAQSGAKGA